MLRIDWRRGKGKSKEVSKVPIVVIWAQDGWDEGASNGRGEKWSNSGHILKVKLAGCADRLYV